MTIDAILAYLVSATDLNDLLCSLIALEDFIRFNEPGRKPSDFIDMTTLPTFGGPEPKNTHDVWSWDADMFLRNEDGRWFVERRDDLELAA